jgi:hypothetical protein
MNKLSTFFNIFKQKLQQKLSDNYSADELENLSPTIAFMKSKKGQKIRDNMRGYTTPIPDSIWKQMPHKLKKIISSAQKEGAIIFYNKATPPDSLSQKSIIPIFTLCDTVTVFYGVLASRIYDVRTGTCIGVS